MIRNIFLDLDDTILDFQAGERVALQRAFTDFGNNTIKSAQETSTPLPCNKW